MTSFAGGLPARKAFPVAEIAEATRIALAEEGTAAPQDATTEGDPRPRGWIAERMNRTSGTALEEQQGRVDALPAEVYDRGRGALISTRIESFSRGRLPG